MNFRKWRRDREEKQEEKQEERQESPERQDNPGKQENRQGRRKLLRNGSYSLAFTAAVLLALVAVNLVAGEIPSKYTQFDISGNGLYTIGEETEALLEGLSQDVTVYLVAQEGYEEDSLVRLLEQYEESSSRVHVEYVDPVKSPAFTSQYTQETVYDNSLIVESGEQSRVVGYEDIFLGGYDYYGSYSVTEFDGEGQLSSAISYVTSEDLPVLYQVTGHNEASLSDSMAQAVSKANIEIVDLNLMTAEAVPEDAGGLFLFAPYEDYTAEEAQKVKDYLAQGGRVLAVTTYIGEELPNFTSILESCGITPSEGIVLEGDASYVMGQNPMYLVPDYGDHEITSSLAGSRYVLLPIAQAIDTLEEVPEGAEITPLLLSSASSYEKADPQAMTSYAKEAEDAAGPFTLGAAVSQALDGGGEMRLVYYTTEGLLDDTMNEAVAGGNEDLFLATLTWLVGEGGSHVSIEPKNVQVEFLTITAASANMWSILTTAVLPAAVLLVGGVVCYRRRKR